MRVTLERWGGDDLAVLQRVNSPEMTRFFGGPESEEEVLARHRRYLRLNASTDSQMYRIDVDGTPVGGIGFWMADLDGEPAFEASWSVDRAIQGRGIATEALRQLIPLAAAREDRDVLVAYPGLDNPASNALCRNLGFELRGTKTDAWGGGELTYRVWVLDLAAVREAHSAHAAAG